jgi:hypothetical protein
MPKKSKVNQLSYPSNLTDAKIAKWIEHDLDDQHYKTNPNKHHVSPIAIIIYSQSLHNHFPKISEQDTKNALKFKNIKKSIEDYQGFKVPQTQPFFINENLVKTISNLLDKVNCADKFSLFLIDHGAPGWFFAPYTLYFREKVGFCWEFDKNLLQHSHYFLDKHDFYYYSFSKNDKIKIDLDNSTFQTIVESTGKSATNGLYKNNAINELNSAEMEWLEKVTKQKYIQPSNFRAKDLHLSEHSNARFFAQIIAEIETQLNIRFSSVHLHSCNTAAEFRNSRTNDKIISPARILSIHLKNRFIFGNVGFNSDSKSTNLWVKKNNTFETSNPKLEQSVVVYKDNKVILKPKKQFFALLNQLSNLVRLIYSQHDENYAQYEYFDDAPESSVLSKHGLFGPHDGLDGLNKPYDTSCLVPN